MGSMRSEDEDWYTCSDWLEKCGMITPEQNKSILNVEHLATILKDGVMLCNLCNKLKENCIGAKNFSQRPQASQFLCHKNIKTFLSTCKTVFGLKDKHLFTPADLGELQDFGKVIFTLSKLSQTKEAKAKNIEPFTAEDGAEYVIVKDILDEVEDEYSSSLYDLSLDNFGNNDHSEDIYDCLVTGDSAKMKFKPKKDLCMDELVDTEKNFIDVLGLIIKIFIKNLKGHLSTSESKEIFFKIEELHKVHLEFYHQLSTARNSNSPAQEISKCFLRNKIPLTIYGDFCSHIITAHTALSKVCASNPPARKIIEDGGTTTKVKLHDLLTVPVQRILKYHLIIREMLKHCNDNPEDTKEIKLALEAMEDLNVYINEVKRDSEGMSIIKEVQCSILDIQTFSDKPVQLEVYGRRHFDGEFKVKSFMEKGFETRYIFLFDRVVIFCKPIRNDQYEYKGSLDLRKCEISTGPLEKGQQTIHLLNTEDNKERYTISAKKSDQVTKLRTYLDIARDNVLPKGHDANNHDFILTNFTEATVCGVCGKLLRGLLSQGYKCRRTKTVVHKECLSKATSTNTNTHSRASKQLPPSPPTTNDDPTTKAPKTSRPRPPAPDPNNYRKSDPRAYSWFSTASSRPESAKLLKNLPDGTFLVRWSVEQQKYVITMKCEQIRHIMINQNEKNEYYLKPTIFFKSVPDLINYFKTKSLQEVFNNIPITLNQNYSEFKIEKEEKQYCKALYRFCATEGSQLSFEEGDIIEVISKKENSSWWKGMLRKKKGYFPTNYVEELKDFPPNS